MNTISEIVINNLDQLISLLAWLFIIFLIYRLVFSYLRNAAHVKTVEKQQQVEYNLRMRQLDLDQDRLRLQQYGLKHDLLKQLNKMEENLPKSRVKQEYIDFIAKLLEAHFDELAAAKVKNETA